MNPPSEYDPEWFAAVHTGNAGDTAFYTRLCRGAEHVLELGCGTARVSIALAREGARVLGIDRSESMLTHAEKRIAEQPTDVRARLRVARGDMTDFEQSQRFDRIIVPFSGMYCLESASALKACLRRVHDHLSDQGTFAFDVYSADDFHTNSRPADYSSDFLEPVAEIERDGERVVVLEKSSWDRRRQRMKATYVYITPEGRVLYEASITHRYFLSTQLDAALAQAKLEVTGCYGDFDGSPYDRESSELLIVTARKGG